MTHVAKLRESHTDPCSRETCGCGVSPYQSDNLGNMCRRLDQSYLCTAAHRVTRRTHPHLKTIRKDQLIPLLGNAPAAHGRKYQVSQTYTTYQRAKIPLLLCYTTNITRKKKNCKVKEAYEYYN